MDTSESSSKFSFGIFSSWNLSVSGGQFYRKLIASDRFIFCRKFDDVIVMFLSTYMCIY